jgi:Mn2+/Fe2+ NRAMP family transporter
MDVEILYVVMAILFILNASVSVFLMKRDDLNTFQKGAQMLLVWLVPFLAAIGVWLLNRSQDIQATRDKTFGGGVSDSIGPGAE